VQIPQVGTRPRRKRHRPKTSASRWSVVFTVSAAAAPGLTEDGLTEHEGVIADAGVTRQVRATEPVNPLTA